MKIAIQTVLLNTAICLLLTSCTKELPYPNATAADLLVLNGLLNPDQDPSIHLSQSCHITNNNCDEKVVQDAEVLLKDEAGNTLVELSHTEDGIYTAEGYDILENVSYKIEASKTDFQTIKSHATIPKSFNSTLVDTGEAVIGEYICRTFEIEIEDNPAETNYYLIDGYVDILNGQHYDNQLEINGYTLPHTGFITNDVNVDNNSMISNLDIYVYPLEFIFLRDESFNGETYTLEFGLYDEDIFYGKDLDLEAHISVKSVSKELYDYYRSITTYKLTAANILAEPEQILSNIEGGIGIFGGYTEKQFSVTLPTSDYYLAENFTTENEGCTSPCPVKFFADLGSKLEFSWDFGDGNTSIEQNPEHTYEDPGIYPVELKVIVRNNSYSILNEVEVF